MSFEQYVSELQHGRIVRFRPRGHSMEPRIRSGALVTVSPETDGLRKGDIVLCRVRGRYYVHLIKAVRGEQYLIGNNRGGTNGWVGNGAIFGRVVGVGDSEE
jgi:phage repressor protein C with HTH and peptisase S24 domain